MHNVHYESFLFSEITFGKDKLARLLEEVKATLEKLVWMCQITKIISFLPNFFTVSRSFTVYM